MKSIFFLVSSMPQYGDEYGYHAHFFEGSGFMTAFIIAMVVAVVCAAIYYFGLCMKVKTISAATLPVWLVGLALSALIPFFLADQILIGHNIGDDNEADETAITYAHSFYRDLEYYYIDISEDAPVSEQEQMMSVKDEIVENLNQGDDVALMFSLNTLIWSVIAYYLFSLLMKGFSINGLAIPHLWPHGRKRGA